MKENYRSSIHYFLKENKVYDCLPKNSQVIVVDRQFSVYETIELIIKNDYEESIIWNSDQSKFDGIITYTDIAQIILQFYKEVTTNGKAFLQRKGSFQQEIEMEGIDEDQLMHSNSMQKSGSEPVFQKNFTIREKSLFNNAFEFPFIPSQHSEPFIFQLKNYSIRQWFRYLSNEESDSKDLITTSLESILQDVSQKMNQKNVHRVIVVDKDSDLVVGVLNYRDILLFLIRNLTKDIDDQSNSSNEYDLPISYLTRSFSKLFPKLFSVKINESTYKAFHAMIHDYQVSSIPVVDEYNKYKGIIYKRDIRFIWRTKNFQILGKPVSEFLEFIAIEKQKYKSTSLGTPTDFQLSETVRQVVEKCMLAPGNRLICVDQDSGQIIQFITLTDIFKYYLRPHLEDQQQTMQASI
ncbi:hypothetical protein PPERSA_03141 [Pseudocohnilembus persalinus]|uniref:CBS domain-containing protein n=1 Tax=Pseudocohnilembus persalinus TaxID=266149 RepID=A0A0V0QIG5_PSEPJ|nr:hypothetical protein PPERSA_03141 [Pseudocohnilembus persalinus]|eukprot:KRX02079.1 hypothetical protein PPERSA_03141 [Pseudocohnilembus persalinus]